MICGAKRYIVEFEMNGIIKQRSVIARTPASARKFIRGKYDCEITILFVQKEN
ncbi:hypothetical protein ACLIBH_10630 [Virgibacillus sp. W0430]|uniref:hypothetical protein n=1 Tax=Virgibacillus sp. W0430 TaxID=3391580 RepID=UPI003F446BA6